MSHWETPIQRLARQISEALQEVGANVRELKDRVKALEEQNKQEETDVH